MKILLTILLSIIILVPGNEANSQIKGKEIPEANPDTTYVYKPSRPLINKQEISGEITSAWGLDMLLSDNGFGLGFFYQRHLSNDWFAFASMYISGARNTDELEMYDRNKNEFYIPNKVNRLFMIPLTIGIQKYLFNELLHDNLKPYVNAGLGPSLIIKTPYEKEFFSSFGQADFFGRFGAFVGCGANVGSGHKALVSVNMRYYYIPFGGEGLESIEDSPLKNFGGIFLSLSLGAKF
ncbi:hypothetical protein ACFLSQ_08215 [Bacteroidota bacterium]